MQAAIAWRQLSGLSLSTSGTNSSISRPSTPPAALISSTASLVPFRWSVSSATPYGVESDDGTPINILSLPAAISGGAASPANAAAADPAAIFSALRRDTGRMVATGFSSPLNVISTSCLARFQTMRRCRLAWFKQTRLEQRRRGNQQERTKVSLRETSAVETKLSDLVRAVANDRQITRR